MNGKRRVTLEINGDHAGNKFFEEDYDILKEKELTITIKKYSKRRSTVSNSYFHYLVGEIAAARGLGEDEVKRFLVCEYGTRARDNEGKTIGFKLPISVDVSKIYPYVKSFDECTENGIHFKCYLCFKQTSDMDTAEMARLIEGTITVAQDLGIDTDTPTDKARLSQYDEMAGVR